MDERIYTILTAIIDSHKERESKSGMMQCRYCKDLKHKEDCIVKLSMDVLSDNRDAFHDFG